MEHENFYKSLLHFIQKYDYQNVIFMGDFNVVPDPNLDWKHINAKSTKKGNILSRPFYDFMEVWDIKDIWRLKNPDKKGFTFYLNCHRTFSRIDMI